VDQGYLLKRDMDEVRAAARVVSADDQDVPRLEALLTFIARYFRVDPNYFLDAAVREKVDEELRLLDLISKGKLQGLVTRAAGLSEGTVAEIIRAVDAARLREGLDQDPLL
jgi:hypothetical protein